MLVRLVCTARGHGYRDLIESVWSEAKAAGIPLPTDRPVSAAAFCKARRRLKSEAIRVLLHDCAATFEGEHGRRHRWNGRRLLAIDGTKFSTQRSDELFEAFGRSPRGHTPHVQLLTLYDVLSQVPLDGTVDGYAAHERRLAMPLLEHVRKRDILLLDRGFPSHEFIDTLMDREIDFVMRVSTESSFRAVEAFMASGRTEQVIELKAKRIAPGVWTSSRRVRAVRGVDSTGQPEVLLTNLTRTAASRKQVLELYRLRWGVETFYGSMKSKCFDPDQFHSRTADGVRQEIFAALLVQALTRTFMAEAARKHRVAYVELAHKNALVAVAEKIVVSLLSTDLRRSREMLAALLKRISRHHAKKRPGRSFKRRSFRPHPKWDANGTWAGGRRSKLG